MTHAVYIRLLCLPLVAVVFVSCNAQKQIRLRKEEHMNASELETMVRAKNMDAPFLARKVGPPGIPILTTCLSDPDPEVRLVAVNSLDAVDDPATIQALVSVLDDEYMPVRTRAVNTLWVRHNTAILPYLYESVKSNPYVMTRSRIPLIIGLIGQQSSLSILEEALEEESNEATMENIVLAMARIGDKDQQDVFVRRLDAQNVKERLKAIKDIVYINDREIGKLLAPLLSDKRSAYKVGKSANRQDARICDAVVNAASEIYGDPFSFEVSSQNIYTDDQLGEVSDFFAKLSQ